MTDEVRMPFGKHKGELITDIPVGYLRWVLSEVELKSENLKNAIETRLEEDGEPREWRQMAKEVCKFFKKDEEK